MSEIEQNKQDLISYFEEFKFIREVTFTNYIELKKTIENSNKDISVVIGSKDFFFVIRSEYMGSIYSKHYSLKDGKQVRSKSEKIIDFYLMCNELL